MMLPRLKVLYLATDCVSGIALLHVTARKNLFYREQSHGAELKTGTLTYMGFDVY